jgi:hypothetical protein
MAYSYFFLELHGQRVFFRAKGNPRGSDFEFYGSDDDLAWEKYTLSSPAEHPLTGSYSYACTGSRDLQSRLIIQDGIHFTLTITTGAISLTSISSAQVPSALREPLSRYPKSYYDFYQPNNNPLQAAKDLLNDYTKGNSCHSSFLSACSLFVSGHWNRHHLKEVNCIVERISNDEINTPQGLVEELNKINHPNPNGSFARRKEFIINVIFSAESADTEDPSIIAFN